MPAVHLMLCDARQQLKNITSLDFAQRLTHVACHAGGTLSAVHCKTSPLAGSPAHPPLLQSCGCERLPAAQLSEKLSTFCLGCSLQPVADLPLLCCWLDGQVQLLLYLLDKVDGLADRGLRDSNLANPAGHAILDTHHLTDSRSSSRTRTTIMSSAAAAGAYRSGSKQTGGSATQLV